MNQRSFRWATCLGALIGLSSSLAHAFPGFFAGKGGEMKSRSSQVVVMKNGDQRVVSIMTDYDGPMQPFAIVIPVPSDVSEANVRALKRDDVERLEELTAPRFHEFWEKDPCEPGKAEQIWEVDLTASESTDFLGAGEMLKGTTKAPPEMKIQVEPNFRDEAEFDLSVVGSNVASVLKRKGFEVPSDAKGRLGDYDKFIVGVVDPRRVELGSKGEALLSPIRFATKQDYEIPVTLGTAHIGKAHELLVYVLDPEQRYEAANYENVYPPTNVLVDFAVKERTGEYYAQVHDKLREKHKDAFLIEYAWSTKGCGEPCPNAPLHVSELLTLGGDVHEENVPGAERNPKPPERTEEEQAVYDAAKPPEKKRMDELAKEVARRKALIARQSDYVLSRLHYRYGPGDVSKDVKLKPAEPIQGGLDVPKGEMGQLPTEVNSASENKMQTRLVNLHPTKVEIDCPQPERYRWGKPPKSFRGARKIWVADRLAWRDRSRLKLEEVTISPVPAVGLPGIQKVKDEAAASAAEAAAKEKEESCDCSLVGTERSSRWSLSLALALLSGLLLRRRRS